MIFAPGNFVRTAHLFPDGFRLTTDVFIEHSKIFFDIISREIFLIVPIVFAPSTVKRAAPFLIAALLIPSAMMFSPVFKDYAGFASPIYLLIASTIALESISIEKFSAFLRPIAVVLLLTMFSALVADFYFYDQVQKQIETIENHRGAEIKLPPMNFDPTLEKFFGARVLNHYVDAEFGRHIMGLSTDPNFYYNRAVANYYGLKSIALEVSQ